MDWEWVTLTGQVGMPTAAAGLVLWLLHRQARRAEEREDKLLDAALHGRRGDDGAVLSPGVRDLVAADLRRGLEPLERSVDDVRRLLESRPCVAAGRGCAAATPVVRHKGADDASTETLGPEGRRS